MDRTLLSDDDDDELVESEIAEDEIAETETDASGRRDKNHHDPILTEQDISEVARAKPELRRSRLSFANKLRKRTTAHISDEIFEQIAVGRSSKAFGEFYELLAPRIYTFIYHALRDEEDALDVLQDTFAELWVKAPKLYTIHPNIAAWGLHLARNLAYEQFRTKHYIQKGLTDSYDSSKHGNLFVDDLTPEKKLTIREAHGEIKEAIEKLNPEQRKSIELVFFADLSRKAAAEKLHIPYNQFLNIIYDSLTELEFELFPYRRKRQVASRQKHQGKRNAVNRKKRAMKAGEDAAARAEALRKFLLGVPLS